VIGAKLEDAAEPLRESFRAYRILVDAQRPVREHLNDHGNRLDCFADCWPGQPRVQAGLMTPNDHEDHQQHQ
jgi:hypothetical protein